MHNFWRVAGFLFFGVGLWYGKPEFEISLLTLICFLGADILQAMKRD